MRSGSKEIFLQFVFLQCTGIIADVSTPLSAALLTRDTEMSRFLCSQDCLHLKYPVIGQVRRGVKKGKRYLRDKWEPHLDQVQPEKIIRVSGPISLAKKIRTCDLKSDCDFIYKKALTKKECLIECIVYLITLKAVNTIQLN